MAEELLDQINKNCIELITKHNIKHGQILQKIRKNILEKSKTMPKKRVLLNASYGGFQISKYFHDYADDVTKYVLACLQFLDCNNLQVVELTWMHGKEICGFDSKQDNYKCYLAGKESKNLSKYLLENKDSLYVSIEFSKQFGKYLLDEKKILEESLDKKYEPNFSDYMYSFGKDKLIQHPKILKALYMFEQSPKTMKYSGFNVNNYIKTLNQIETIKHNYPIAKTELEKRKKETNYDGLKLSTYENFISKFKTNKVSNYNIESKEYLELLIQEYPTLLRKITDELNAEYKTIITDIKNNKYITCSPDEYISRLVSIKSFQNDNLKTNPSFCKSFFDDPYNPTTWHIYHKYNYRLLCYYIQYQQDDIEYQDDILNHIYLSFGLKCASDEHSHLKIDLVPYYCDYKICDYDGVQTIELL